MKGLCLLLILLASPRLGAGTVTLDIPGGGRVFEGFGALRAGASSKLLIDYPEPRRSEGLDLPFKPRHGASLQHLKVEIGGDVNSTCGTEPAFAHTREEFLETNPAHFKRGYEGWLMVESKQRNPLILLDALQWGAPYWIGDGSFYSQNGCHLPERTRRVWLRVAASLVRQLQHSAHLDEVARTPSPKQRPSLLPRFEPARVA